MRQIWSIYYRSFIKECILSHTVVVHTCRAFYDFIGAAAALVRLVSMEVSWRVL